MFDISITLNGQELEKGFEQALVQKPKRYLREIDRLLKQAGSQAIREFEKPAKSFSEKPKFKLKVSIQLGNRFVEVGTNHEVYRILNFGAPPHPITIKNAPFLVFKDGVYSPKTTPNTLQSKSGKPRQGNVIKVKRVKHPGLKARNWSSIIGREAEKKLISRLESAAQRTLK